MKLLKLFLISTCFTISVNLTASNDQLTQAELTQEATDYFHTYLNTYNKRFGHPDRKESFITELSSLLLDAFMMAPVKSKPRIIDNRNSLDRGFNGFVGQLEKKGAKKLHWKNISLRVLSPKKILANNSAYATNAKGEVVYETVSIYLLVLDNEQWKIALFNPYTLENEFSF